MRVLLHLLVMASHLSLISSEDNSTKQISVVSSPVEIKTHVIWKPPASRTRTAEEPKLIILPLGAFLALLIATCTKISHWWNEDIREADGLLENVYSAKYPHRPVLARVMSTESPSYEGFTKPPFLMGQSEDCTSCTVIQTPLRTEPECPSEPQRAPSVATEASIGLSREQSEESIPLLPYITLESEVPTTVLTPVVDTTTKVHNRVSRKPRKEVRHRNRKRLTKSRSRGVSRLVMNSLNFNLFFLKLDVEDTDSGFIDDSFVQPGQLQDVNKTVKSGVRRNWPLVRRSIGSKPSTSSFSSQTTSSTSLSTELSDSRNFYHIAIPRSPSLSSDSGASSDIIWEHPNQCPEEAYVIEDSFSMGCHSNACTPALCRVNEIPLTIDQHI